MSWRFTRNKFRGNSNSWSRIPTVESPLDDGKIASTQSIVQNATRISKAYRILVYGSFNFLLFFSMRATRLPLKCRLFVGVESSTPASHYGLERLLNMICTFNERCVSLYIFAHICVLPFNYSCAPGPAFGTQLGFKNAAAKADAPREPTQRPWDLVIESCLVS